MLIAVDYDNTYTRDTELWDRFIDMCIENGHIVICATMRYDYEGKDVINTIGKKCKVYFTGRNAKKFFLEEMNIFPDVWIDDNPMWVYKNG